MIRHLFKLVWRRKRESSLLILEVFISFLVVFALSLVAVQVWTNYLAPMGYTWRSAWVVQISVQRTLGVGLEDTTVPAELQRLLVEARSMPEVVSAGLLTVAPYQEGRMLNAYEVDGRVVQYELAWSTVGTDSALGIVPTRGRWFEEADLALAHRPVVLDERLAADLFPGEDPIGKEIPRGAGATGAGQRIIGVIPTYRMSGELSAPANYLFEQVGGTDADGEPLASNIVLKVRDGVDAGFEERLMRRLQGVAPRWSFETRPMAHMRESYLRNGMAPLLIGAVVAAFMMLMVGLGLTGVLWQNVTQRTREIGLRRATGATGGDVQRQVLGEILILATLGMGTGILVIIQLPLLDLLGSFRGTSFGAALAVSVAILYALSALCAYYPGRLATRITPVEALHHD